MKKLLALVLTCTMILTIFAACGSKEEAVPTGESTAPTGEDTQASDEPSTGEKLKVTLLVTGSFGDKSFNDSAQAGIKKVTEELADRVDTKMIEMGADKTKFEPSLLDASDSDADIIIVGTWDMKEILESVAPLYPEKRYIIFDTDVDYDSFELDNVYSMSYKQNEAAFLAGVLAAQVTTSDMEFANEDAVIGFVGAKDTAAVINDSAVGFIQGAQFVNPDIKVQVSYVGSYVDSATAKEVALTQYSTGVDCIFVAAGPSSVGVIEAATESSRYVIGVDSDQALAYAGEPEEQFIISSAIKGVGTTIHQSVEKNLDGTLTYGSHQLLGLAEGAVGLAENNIYNTVVPEELRAKVTEAQTALLAGGVQLDTAFGMDEARLKEIIASAQ